MAANTQAISLTPFPAAPTNTPPSGFAPSTPLSLLPAAAAPPQDVTSVFENYAWQLYGGYTFLKFYELPGITPSMNGFNYSVVYYWKDWFGFDGEFAATHATQDDVSSWFLFGGGGPRFRWSAKKGVELWAHALVGYSHFTPQTPAGNQHAFAYELGGGVDLPFKPRWALRLGADAMCTTYFSTHQFSPTAHAGVVFRF
ncbi:MAG: outer membrane beta-barrel protein [Candidatus Acidiferrales bacterium]